MFLYSIGLAVKSVLLLYMRFRCSCIFYDKLRQKNIIYCFFFVTLCDFGFEIDILTDNNKFNI